MPQPKLTLVQSAEIVQLREPSTFDEAWKARAGQMKTRGDGVEKTRKLWNTAAKTVGQFQLLEALRKFLRETKEPTCGHPGLSVWLNGQRYDHWLDSDAEKKAVQSKSNAPIALREAVVLATDEGWVVSYLDPCTFHEDGWITPRTSYARDKLKEKASVLKAAGLVGIRLKE